MYLNENKSDDDLFPETKEENQLCYYVYDRKIECYKGKIVQYRSHNVT